MSKEYLSISGDIWDGIALKTMGDEKYKNILMEANRQHRYVYIFPAGIRLVIPEIPVEVSDELPPWKR